MAIKKVHGINHRVYRGIDGEVKRVEGPANDVREWESWLEKNLQWQSYDSSPHNSPAEGETWCKRTVCLVPRTTEDVHFLPGQHCRVHHVADKVSVKENNVLCTFDELRGWKSVPEIQNSDELRLEGQRFDHYNPDSAFDMLRALSAMQSSLDEVTCARCVTGFRDELFHDIDTLEIVIQRELERESRRPDYTQAEEINGIDVNRWLGKRTEEELHSFIASMLRGDYSIEDAMKDYTKSLYEILGLQRSLGSITSWNDKRLTKMETCNKALECLKIVTSSIGRGGAS